MCPDCPPVLLASCLPCFPSEGEDRHDNLACFHGAAGQGPGLSHVAGARPVCVLAPGRPL